MNLGTNLGNRDSNDDCSLAGGSNRPAFLKKDFHMFSTIKNLNQTPLMDIFIKKYFWRIFAKKKKILSSFFLLTSFYHYSIITTLS